MKRTVRQRNVIAALAVLASIAFLAPQSSSAAAKKPSANSVDPNAPEIVSPGDIPDDIAFIPYAPAKSGHTVSIPEGWSRRDLATGAIFTDKYNIVQVERLTAQTAPTTASVGAALKVRFASTPSFRLGKVGTTKRSAGRVVVANYSVASAPNDVTGKSITVSVERYEFHRQGISVVLTLSGAKGADNVDPWRTITNSFAWTSS